MGSSFPEMVVGQVDAIMAANAPKGLDRESQMHRRTSPSSKRFGLLAAVFCLLLLAFLASSCSRSEKPSRSVLVLGFREGTVGEERNPLLDYGCRRIGSELGLEAELVVPGPSEDVGDYPEDGDPSRWMLVGCGEAPEGSTSHSPGRNPVTHRVWLDYPGDSVPPGGEGDAYIRYRVEEGAYLCGFLAGRLTVSGEHPLVNRLPVVAFIGCAADPRTARYQAGFAHGVLTAYPQANLLSYLVDDCRDEEQARAFAQEAAKKGADIIFCTPGAFNDGVLRAAESFSLLVILAGGDRSRESPSHVLTSLILRDDNALFRAVDLAFRDQLKPGLHEWGVREGVWSLAPFRSHDIHIRRELKEALATEEEKVSGMDFTP